MVKKTRRTVRHGVNTIASRRGRGKYGGFALKALYSGGKTRQVSSHRIFPRAIARTMRALWADPRRR